jgi:hypothetical protein
MNLFDGEVTIDHDGSVYLVDEVSDVAGVRSGGRGAFRTRSRHALPPGGFRKILT